jgi:hypothetical protein
VRAFGLAALLDSRRPNLIIYQPFSVEFAIHFPSPENDLANVKKLPRPISGSLSGA